MALRVLLADESSTIKKVMQLALSDFAVEVRSVPVGFDVLPVAKNFKPDIVFADVLLSKKSGYDACAELKQNPQTAHIPVVLMWSGFMEIDAAKLTESQADGRLEKPFDADGLRQIVQDLVQKTKSNPISQFLDFPAMPDFEENKLQSPPAIDQDMEELFEVPALESFNEKAEPFESLKSFESYKSLENLENMEPFETIDSLESDFSDPPIIIASNEDQEDGGWTHKDLTKYKLNIPIETDSTDFASKFVIPQDEEALSTSDYEFSGHIEEVGFESPSQSNNLKLNIETDSIQKNAENIDLKNISEKMGQVQTSVTKKIEKSVKDQMLESLKRGPSAAQPNTQSQSDLDPELVEKIIQKEAREVIEAVCWKVLPEIAERLVKEELNKILRNIEKSI